MNDALQIPFYIHVLTPPRFVEADGFATWLRQEVRALHDLAQEDRLIIVRLYLARRIKADWSRKELDALLQSMTNQYPRIFRIELMVMEGDLTPGEITLLQKDAEKEITHLGNSMRRFADQQAARSKLH